MFRCAFNPKGRAIVRFFHSLQNLTGNAQRGFVGSDGFDLEALFCIEPFKRRAQIPAAHRDDANAAPFAVDLHENGVDHLLCRLVAIKGDRALVGVENFNLACLEQAFLFAPISRY